MYTGLHLASFEVLTAMSVKLDVLWDIARCCLEGIDGFLGGITAPIIRTVRVTVLSRFLFILRHPKTCFSLPFQQISDLYYRVCCWRNKIPYEDI